MSGIVSRCFTLYMLEIYALKGIFSMDECMCVWGKTEKKYIYIYFMRL